MIYKKFWAGLGSMSPSTNEGVFVPAGVLVFIALIQGLMLLLLHQSIKFEFWPNNEPQWLVALYAVVIFCPTMLLLSCSEDSRSVYPWVGVFAAVLLLLGYYTGREVGSWGIDAQGLSAFAFTMLIATFKALIYVQSFSAEGKLTYSRLFRLSWRNFLTLSLSLLFTMCVWMILMLWAQLFVSIKIEFFYDLFTSSWFYYPILALVNGFGVIILRHQSGIIEKIIRIKQELMKFLLLILTFACSGFLAALLFSGIKPLWETGGSTSILWMQALMLFFVNAVYQDEPVVWPYSVWVHRFICLGVALLPIYSIISFYGLFLRVDQYGWTLVRSWAFLLWGVFSAFSMAYLWNILRLRDLWLKKLGRVNVRLGLLVFGTLLLASSPVLDFRKISLASQLSRLEQGKVAVENFDYAYLRQLGRPGYEALGVLQDKIESENPNIALKISELLRTNDKQEEKQTIFSRDLFLKNISGINENTPDALLEKIYENLSKELLEKSWPGQKNMGYHLIGIDMNKDQILEYVFIEIDANYQIFTMYRKSEAGWTDSLLTPWQTDESEASEEIASGLLDALQNSEYEVVENKWHHLRIGEYHLQVAEVP